MSSVILGVRMYVPTYVFYVADFLKNYWTGQSEKFFDRETS